MDRTQKEASVASLQAALQDTNLVVVAHYSGLTVAEMTSLRQRMRGANASMKVAKNRLARIAIKGTRFEGIDKLLKGPTAIAYSSDPVAAAKVAADFAKENDKFVILGGGLGEQTLDAAGVQALAKLPSINELRAKLVGLVQAPATKVAGVVQAPAGQLARLLGAYAAKGDAA